MKLRQFLTSLLTAPVVGLCAVKPAKTEESPLDSFKHMADSEGKIWSSQFSQYLVENLPCLSKQPFIGPVTHPFALKLVESLRGKPSELICYNHTMSPVQAHEYLNTLLYACSRLGVFIREVQTENLTFGNVPISNSRRNIARVFLESKPRACV